MKPVVNSSFTKYAYEQAVPARAAWQSLRIPNYVWLAMLMTAAGALSLGTLARERQEMRQATAAYVQTQGLVKGAEAQNLRLKAEVKGLREDSRAAERVAQERLNYVRSNEIVVTTR